MDCAHAVGLGADRDALRGRLGAGGEEPGSRLPRHRVGIGQHLGAGGKGSRHRGTSFERRPAGYILG